jgi:hypothetical protein
MRRFLVAASVAGTLGALCSVSACGAPQGRLASASPPPTAVAAQRYARPAVETSRAQQGYSDAARRRVDCAASFPNYDPATDLYQPRPGETRACPL